MWYMKKREKRYYVQVYSGRRHWDVLIEDICGGFDTRKVAEEYATAIAEHRPNYWIVIEED